MILLAVPILLSLNESLSSSEFWTTLLSNLPGLGAVGLVIVLLFRTYWRAEEREERAASRLESEMAELRRENAELRSFITTFLLQLPTTHPGDAQEEGD